VTDRLAYSVEDAAHLLSLSRSQLYAFLKDGLIVGKKLGGRTVIPRDELERFLVEAPSYTLAGDA
jgi:excisionase family DNA binding protein